MDHWEFDCWLAGRLREERLRVLRSHPGVSMARRPDNVWPELLSCLFANNLPVDCASVQSGFVLLNQVVAMMFQPETAFAL
jgi:hypothetical protein